MSDDRVLLANGVMIATMIAMIIFFVGGHCDCDDDFGGWRTLAYSHIQPCHADAQLRWCLSTLPSALARKEAHYGVEHTMRDLYGDVSMLTNQQMIRWTTQQSDRFGHLGDVHWEYQVLTHSHIDNPNSAFLWWQITGCFGRWIYRCVIGGVWWPCHFRFTKLLIHSDAGVIPTWSTVVHVNVHNACI